MLAPRLLLDTAPIFPRNSKRHIICICKIIQFQLVRIQKQIVIYRYIDCIHRLTLILPGGGTETYILHFFIENHPT